MSKKTLKQLVLLFFFCAVAAAVVMNLSEAKQSVGGFISALSPLYIGALIAFLLNMPLAKIEKLFLRRSGKPRRARALSLIIVYVLFVALLALVVLVLVPALIESVDALYERLPDYFERMTLYYERITEKLGIRDFTDGIFKNYGESIMSNVGRITAELGTALLKFGMKLGEGVIKFVLALIFSIYILAGKEKLKEDGTLAVKRAFSEKTARTVLEAAAVSSNKLSSFIGGQVLDAAVLGGLCCLGMVLIGLPYATLVGMIVAITALVPIIGGWVGAGISALLILMENPVQALIFVVFIVALQQFENNLIYPKIVGEALGMSGLWVLVAVTVGGALFGVAGMFFAAPLCSVLQHYFEKWKTSS